MARKKVETRIPTSFDMWLACHLLTLSYVESLRLNVLLIIDAYVKQDFISIVYTLDLRKYWFELITMGLTEEERNELVNK